MHSSNFGFSLYRSSLRLAFESPQSRIIVILARPNFLGSLEIQQLWLRPVSQICGKVNWYCQKDSGKPSWSLVHLSLSIRVWFFIFFAAPFCYSVFFKKKCQIMPSCLQNSMNLSSRNSPPLSLGNYFVFCPIWFSIFAFHSLNFTKTLGFSRMK